MTAQRMTVGSTIFHARNLRNLTPQQLADIVQIDPRRLKAVEANQVALDFDLALRLAAVLQVQVGLLVPDFAAQRTYEGVANVGAIVGESGTRHEAWRWIEGLEGKRVRVTVEVLDAPTPSVPPEVNYVR